MKKGAFYIAFATLVFSTMEIALKFVSGQFDPIQMTFSRFFVGGLVLLPVALKKIKEKGVKIDKSSFLYFTMLGFFGIFLFGTFYQLAISRIQSSVVAVTFSSNPVFVTLLAYLILREPISKNQVAGLIFDIIGILIIINPFNTQLDAMGIIFVLLATFFFSLYAVLGKRETKKYGGLVVTCFGFLIGAVEMMIVSALGNIPAIAELFTSIGLEKFANVPFLAGYTPANLPIMLYAYIGVTGLGFCAYFLSMEKTSAAETSLVFFFKPALAPVLALLILGAPITMNMFIGILLILAGSMVSIYPNLKKVLKK